jgi:hypothetical protein
VDAFCRPGRRVVLWAYDLAQQIRISQALVHLPSLGWDLNRIVLERTAAWASLLDGKRSLMLCDLKAWAPVEFGKIAADVTGGIGNPFVFEAGTQFHRSNTELRTTVIREAVLQILNWIEGENLGPFRPTGSGQSYAAFRRRFSTHKLLVHDDTDRLSLERAAMHTGRCEAWRHGVLNDGPYVEYDMQAAYCHIAAECDVPTLAVASGGVRTVKQVEADMKRYAVLCDVTVTTDVPCVPARHGGRTLWPVGTFRTALWDTELQLAFGYATDVRIHACYRYLRGPALRVFAEYVLEGMDAQTNVYGLVTHRVFKHWSRCLVGRLGLRYRAWEDFGRQDTPDLRLVRYVDTDDGVMTDMLIAGHKRMILADMAESPESLPQIPSWIMAECRRRLWETMTSVGLHSVVYVDTDSIVVQLLGDKPSLTQPSAEWPDIWTHKGAYASMTIYGPRNLVAHNQRRVAGLPLTARQVAPLEFSGNVMRSVKESMRSGQLDCVATIPRKFVLDAPDLRRQHLPDGRTEPFTVKLPTTSEDDE